MMDLVKWLLWIYSLGLERVLDLMTRFNDYRLNRAVMQYRAGKIGIGGLLLVFITVLIGVALAGPFQTQVTDNLVNYTGGAKALGDQLPMFYVILIIGVIVTPIALEFAKLDR